MAVFTTSINDVLAIPFIRVIFFADTAINPVTLDVIGSPTLKILLTKAIKSNSKCIFLSVKSAP